MFIKTEWIGGWVVFIALLATFFDLRYRKIFNALTFPAILLGLFFSFVSAGVDGFLQGLLGCGIVFVAFSWMWAARFLGAGDVKLLMAFASISGCLVAQSKNPMRFVGDLSILTLVVGGVFAVMLLLVHGRGIHFLKRLTRSIYTLVHPGLKGERLTSEPQIKMPFGFAISTAAVWVWFDNPLVRWGITPWK